MGCLRVGGRCAAGGFWLTVPGAGSIAGGMITRLHAVFRGGLLLVAGSFPLVLSAQTDWASRLATPSLSDREILVRAERQDDLDALAAATANLDQETLQLRSGLLNRFVPGGDLSGRVSETTRSQMVESWMKTEDGSRALAYRLWRIHQLSPGEDLKQVALEALESLPEEVLPAAAVASFSTASSGPDPAKLARGKEVYMRPAVCFTCHQPNGQGIPGAFPPLAGSPWLDGDTDRLIKIVLKGMMGELTVNGEIYNNIMAPLELMLKDDEIADVLTYVRHEWGQGEDPDVTTEQVAALRAALAGRATPWQVDEILKEHPLRGE